MSDVVRRDPQKMNPTAHRYRSFLERLPLRVPLAFSDRQAFARCYIAGLCQMAYATETHYQRGLFVSRTESADVELSNQSEPVK